MTEALEHLPSPPFTVDVRSSSGRTMLSLAIPDRAATNNFGHAARVDLPCGRIDLWVGPPLLGGSSGPGTSGDCVP